MVRYTTSLEPDYRGGFYASMEESKDGEYVLYEDAIKIIKDLEDSICQLKNQVECLVEDMAGEDL